MNFKMVAGDHGAPGAAAVPPVEEEICPVRGPGTTQPCLHVLELKAKHAIANFALLV